MSLPEASGEPSGGGSVPRREIVQADALEWMRANPAEAGASVVTSLPDASELPHLGLEGWREWFIGAARAVIRWTPPEGRAIFYQSDIRHEGVWIDKSYLVLRAAEEERAHLVWRKVVCRKPPGTIARGRPSYSHMLCLARRVPPPAERPGPDVLPDAGAMPWSRAMGETACRVACRYLREETATTLVVDPFCGRGTVLAVANAMGFDALGIDLSAKRCRAARAYRLDAPTEDATLRGARLFDAGEYFEAHEAWEERWRVETSESDRLALQGLIQIAAGLHKLFDWKSVAPASRLLAKGVAKLALCPDDALGLDLGAFRAGIEACLGALASGDLARASIPRLVR
jgi:hypothetical protein